MMIDETDVDRCLAGDLPLFAFLIDEEGRAGEQGSAEWFYLRAQCHATASEFSSVCNRNYFASRDNLLLRKLDMLDKFCGNSATRYGQYCEDIAVRDYEAFSAVKVEKAGLEIHPVYRNFGGSPDGLVGEEGLIEVKCPFKYRDTTRLPRHRVCPRQYKDQVQGLLAITGRKWCDLVVWCPRDMVVVRVERDRPYWEKEILPHLLSFSKELTRRRLNLGQARPPKFVDVFASEFSSVCKRNAFVTRTKVYRKKTAQIKRAIKKAEREMLRKQEAAHTRLCNRVRRLPDELREKISGMATDLYWRKKWDRVLKSIREIVPTIQPMGSKRDRVFRFGLLGWIQMVQGKTVTLKPRNNDLFV